MNEEALQEAFRLFTSEGYNGDINKFVNLISTNEEALQEAYKLFASEGYNGDINKFKTLIGVGQQQPSQQPEQQPVVQPTVKKKDDMDSDWLFGDGSSESEPSKTEPETDLFGRAQKVLNIKEPQQKQVGEYDPNAYIEGVAKPKEPVLYMKASTPLRNVEGGYADVQNQLAEIDKKIAESSPYEASLLVLDRNKLLLRKKEIEDSPVRTSDNRPFDITAPKFLEDGLNALTPKQLASYGAKGAKETFDYYFKDAGFKFETDREYVKAISPDGREYTYNTLYPSRESLDEFKNFVRESAFNNPEIADKAYLYEKENKKFKTKEDISNELKTISTQEEQYMGDYKKMINLYRDIENIEADLKRWRDNGEKNTAKYIQTEAYLNDRLDEYNKYNVDLDSKIVDLKAQRTQLDKAVGKYTEFQATQGDFGGNIYRTITNTISGNFSQFLRLAVGKTIDITPMSFLLGEENYQSQRDIRLKEKGYKDEKVVPISVLNEIDDEIREEFKKTAISGKIGDKKLDNILSVQGVRQAISETLNAPITTTDEYLRERQEKGSWIERGLLGLSGSLPAMVGGPAMRYINMYLMNTDAAMQEMDNNPNFANISENEKQLVALPIGVVSAALEEIGLKNLKLGKSITSGIIKTVIGRVPAGASASVIRNTTFDVVAEMGIKGTSAYVGGLLSEAETGILQQASEYAIKDIYESKWFRNRDMFDNPAFLSGQYIYDLYDSGRTELVGAGVMSVPYSIAAAYQKDGFRALDDATFKIFEDLAKDNDSRKFFVTSLKNKINLGEVTPTQGKQMLEAYDQASGMIGMVPDEITDPESRKVAMDLMSERIRLEKQKYGKDEALAKPIQNKINQINEQLTQLTEDAIQKQAAGEVSLQPEAGTGQEVEVGGPEAKPKITPEESKRKEDLVAAFEDPKETEVLEDGKPFVYIKVGEYYTNKERAQAELDALNQKEQALVTEQVGMEQAEGLGTQLEAVAKEEIPAEVTPVEQQFTEQDRARKAELEDAMRKADKRRKNITVGETTMPKAEAKAELDALNQKEQAAQQPVTPAVTPTATAPVETMTAEQEADLLEELMTGKKKETALVETAPTTPTVEPVVTETVTEAAPIAEEVVPVTEEAVTEEVAPKRTPSFYQKSPSSEGVWYNNESSTTIKDDSFVEFYENPDGTLDFLPTTELNKLDRALELRGSYLSPMMGFKVKKNLSTITANDIKQGLESGQYKLIPGKAVKSGGGIKLIQKAELVEVKAEPTSKEAIAKRLRGKKNKGLMSSIDFGISQALYNGALEFMASQVEKGTKLGNAIENTIKWIDEKMQGKSWDKDGFTKYANTTFVNPIDNIEATTKALETVDVNKLKLIGAPLKYDRHALNKYFGLSFADENALLRENKEYRDLYEKDELGNITENERERIKEIYLDRAKKVAAQRISEAYHKAKADGSNPELVQAVEEAVGKPKGKKLSDTIRGLEIKGPGGLQSNILGVPIAIWNSAIKTTAAAIDASVAVAEALQRGSAKIKNWIKKNDPFNKLTDEKINNKILRETFAGAVKIARDNNVSEEGIKTYLKRKGLTDEQIEVVVKKRESKPATTQAEVKEKTTAKKVDVSDIKELEQIVKLQEDAINAGKTSVTEAVKEFIRLFNKSKIITKLTRSDLNKIINLMGKVSDYKSLQTATGKMFDIILKSNPDLIEVSKTKLAEEFKKKVNAGIRQGKKDLNTKRKELTAAIKDMKKKGSISVRQAKALINRINAVNLDNPVMVERLLTYAENIFNDADYDTRVQEVRKLQEQVKKVNHVSMRDTVREFASINPERIPADKLLDYIQALDDMNTRTPFYEKMNDMFDEVMSYKSESKEFDAIKTFQALIDKLESIAINQVKSVEDYVALIRDINSFKRKAYQLLQNGDITQEQYDQAIENVGKDQAAVEKKYEKGLTALKKGLVQEIMGLKPEVHPDFTPEEAALINKYLELSEADLESLSPEDLYILNDLLNNIKEDVQLDYYRLSEIVSKAYTNAGGQKLAEQLNESKFDKSSDEGKKLLLEQESAFWEGLLGLGRATSGALQKFIVSPFNRAIASFENFMKDGYSEFSKLKKKYRMKDYNMHRLGVFTAYLQEYMAQFDPANKNVENIGKRDWFGEILGNEDMRDGYKSAKPSAKRLIGMGDTELKTIEKIYNSLPKDANGKVDPKAVYDSFMANDGKFFTKQEKAFFDKVMEWKQKNLTTKQKAANEMSGMPFKEIPFHMMRVRLDRGAKQISPKAEGGAGKVRIEAGTGKERAKQTVGPIMTNFEQLFTENLEQTARNYYLREAINDINNTLSVAKKGLDKNKTGLFNTIPGTISDALNFEFDKTDSQVIFKSLLAARAAETLFNPIRTAVELTSAFLSYPFRAKTPKGYRELFGKQGKMKKLLDFTDSPIRLRDNINKAIDISDGRIKPLGKFEKAVNYLSGLPERTMLITSWMPTFNNEFKDITGVRFDMDKFNSSAEYRQKYGKAIKEAAAVADAQTEKIIGSTTKAGGRREIRIAPKILANVIGLEGTVKKNSSAGQILGFFSNYPYREVTEFLNGFREAAEVYKQGGKIKSISQLQKPLGVVINLAAYGFLSSVVYAMKLMLLGDDEDEEKGEGMLKELMTPKGFMEELQGNAISLGASKYAAGGKAMLQMFATIAYNSTSDKEQKARIKKILKNSVFVEPIDAEKVQGYGGKNELLGAISSYVPQVVLFAKRIEETIQTAGELNYIYKKFQDGGLKALSEDEGLAILAIDGLLKTTQTVFNFTGTSLPMYNDIKMYMKGAKKEAGVGNIKLSATENQHKKALQNYKNEKEFKENDPEGYLKAIDESGSLYEYKLEQSKKEEEANKDKPFRGMSEEAFKKKFPKEWREDYGPGTKYYYKQRTPAARKKRAEMKALQKKENAIKAKNKKKQNERNKEE